MYAPAVRRPTVPGVDTAPASRWGRRVLTGLVALIYLGCAIVGALVLAAML